MKAFNIEHLREIKKITVNVALYVRAITEYPGYIHTPDQLHKAEMLLIHARDLRDSQDRLGYEYAKEEDLIFWEKHCLETLERIACGGFEK